MIGRRDHLAVLLPRPSRACYDGGVMASTDLKQIVAREIASGERIADVARCVTHARGHMFDERLRCACGQTYHRKQNEPTECPIPVKPNSLYSWRRRVG